MKIAVITSGVLPVPAVRGGAVETLTDFYLDYNERFHTHEFVVYTVAADKSEQKGIKHYGHTRFINIRTEDWLYRVKRFLFKHIHSPYYYNNHWDFFLYGIMKRMEREAFDCILIENRPGFVLPLSQKFPDKRIILHLHNDTLNVRTKQGKEIMERCSQILTVSEFIKRKVETIGSLCPVKVIYNGIDTKPFDLPVLRDFREKWEIDKDDFVIVFTGRTIPEKGISQLIKSIEMIDNEKIKLLIVGGRNDCTKELEHFRELCNLAVRKVARIKFTGYIPYPNIPSLLSIADMAVVPSVWEEPFGLTALEHMAAGLPLIVTRSGGLPEIVDNKCAILLENDDKLSENLASAIIQLYRDPDLRKQMSVHAKERSRMFDKEKYARSFLKVIS